MWPLLLLIPLFFTGEKKKCACSVAHGDFLPDSPCYGECKSRLPESLPPSRPCHWVEAWTEIDGAEEIDPAVLAAYYAVSSNPYATSGDWYYLAQLAESYGAHEAAACFHSAGENRELAGS